MERPSKTLLGATCLKSNYSLRRQLLSSFGTSAVLTLTIVVILASISAHLAGEQVKGQSDEVLRAQVIEQLIQSSEFVAQDFSAFIDALEGTVQLIVEATQERIVGYPNDGYEDDLHVPFLDMDTGTNKYPLRSPLVPLDWNINVNVDVTNAEEHLQERAPLAQVFQISSELGGFFFQGACDPAATNSSELRYYPNCTDANNDFETGGVVAPSNQSKWLHEKGSDLVVFLKPVYETLSTMLLMGIYFVNQGAGAHVEYPGHVILGNGDPFVSRGCDWMREINPYTGERFGTEEDIARCHPTGSLVHQREYNALERAWYKEFVLHPEETRIYGPFLAAGGGIPLVSMGRAVFDKRTGHLIGCVALDLAVSTLNQLLEEARVHPESELAVVRYDTGIIVADSLGSVIGPDGNPIHITDTAIVDETAFAALKSAFSFTKESDFINARAILTETVVPYESGHLVTGYPLPFPPEQYDPSYKPEYLIVHAVSEEIFSLSDEIDDEIDEDVGGIILLSVGLGFLGMIVVLVIVWCVSRMLTRPLLLIESVAWRIVNHTDKRAENAFQVPEENDMSATLACAPTSETSRLVSEFRTMIQGFSGEGASKVAESGLHEIPNEFTWQSDFQQLYGRVAEPRRSFKSGTSSTDATEESSGHSAELPRTSLHRLIATKHDVKAKSKSTSSLIVPAPPKRNTGHNIIPLGGGATSPPKDKVGDEKIQAHRSSLFWWILILIAIPSLLTMVAICAVVTTHIFSIVPSWVDSAGDASYELELSTLKRTAVLKASLLRTRMMEPVRDSYLHTRIAGWLLFGGITRSDSFTLADEVTEECKDGSCLNLDPVTTTVCSCEWKDPRQQTCTSFPEVDTRLLQRRFWAVQARDADNVTGRRDAATSFPELDNSPETTWWWNSTAELPGVDKGVNASGYETTYDRVRVSSAMAIVDMPIYNYAASIGRPKQDLGTFIAFDTDGMTTGFSGCGHVNANMAEFVSSEENGAAEIAPELCPIGKYGYDPRCRDWYATGKRRSLTWGEPVHFTAPYQFAINGEVASSATAPLINPSTGEYAGQTLMDFFPMGVRASLEGLDTPLSIVITPEEDVNGGDTIVGPNKTEGWKSAPIGDLVFLEDDSVNRATFEGDILPDMKSGKSGHTYFSRLKDDGTEETLTFVFEPVDVRIVQPMNPSNFTRGASVSRKVTHSVGIACLEEAMRKPFKDRENAVNDDLDVIARTYLALVVFFSVLLIVFTYRIAIHVTRPIITLLKTVENINSGKIEDDIPPLHGGSSEVYQVYNSFAKLCKIVRISNTAFFSGNLQWAYHFTSDALELYRKIDDRKAIGIASNNLGNTLHALHQEKSRASKQQVEADDNMKSAAALKYLDEAVEIAQMEFDAETVEDAKADFAQQLADRLFNRGLFYLRIKGDEGAPDNAQKKGHEDIERTRGLDYDVKDFWLERKLLLKNSASCFSRLLRRIHGLVDFHSDKELAEVWNVKELIEDAEQLLFAAWKVKPAAPIFKDISRVGRLQQLEAAVIRYEFCSGNQAEAASLAMRMFTEDEYLLECSFTLAASALLGYFHGSDCAPWSSTTVSSARADLRKMLKSCKGSTLDIGKCFIFSLEMSERWEDDPILEKINANCLRLFDQYCGDEDYIGLVAQSSEGELSMELARKATSYEQHRAMLHISTLSTSERFFPAFPVAVQMVVDAAASTDNDSYILLLTDGFSWDSEAYASMKSQIERLNSERNTAIHVIILGVDVEEDWIIEQCKTMCTVSKKSLYVDVTLENIDEAFDGIAGLLGGYALGNQGMQGITMEKF